jgi:hypothetical protein
MRCRDERVKQKGKMRQRKWTRKCKNRRKKRDGGE